MYNPLVCKEVFERIQDDENTEISFDEITHIINTILLVNEMFIKRNKLFITKEEYKSILLDEYLPRLLLRIKFYQTYHVLSLDYEPIDIIVDLILIHYASKLPYHYLSDSLKYVFKNTVDDNDKYFKYDYKILCLFTCIDLHPHISAFSVALILSIIIMLIF